MTYTFDKEKSVLGRSEIRGFGFASPCIVLEAGSTFSQARKEAFAADCLAVDGKEIVEILITQRFHGKPSNGSPFQSFTSGTKWKIYRRNFKGKWFLAKTESRVD